MDLRQQAELIYRRLNEKGACLGNVSVLIIESALQEIGDPTMCASDALTWRCVRCQTVNSFTNEVCFRCETARR